MPNVQDVLARVKADIDGHSYLVTYNNQATKFVVVFVHGIFGNYQETWHSTPLELMNAPILAEADYASFGYGTQFIDFRDQSRVVDQFILWLTTHLKRYESIFVVAHSMGGLITRDVCTQLVHRGSADQVELYTKLRHCFFIAVPLGGAKFAKLLANVPFLARLNRKLPYLASPTLAPSDLAHYASAIARAEERALPRPRFSLFVGTDDVLVDRPASWAMTKDDIYEGPLPGSHTSIKEDLTPNSTLIRRIAQVITTYRQPDIHIKLKAAEARLESERMERAAAQAGPLQEQRARNRGVRDVIVLSCSFGKETQGNELHPGQTEVVRTVADSDVGMVALQTRVKIMTLIQQGRLEGVEFKEGNRAARRENRDLLLGPDFGGAINEPRYLPAYRRYRGRSYQANDQEWRQFMALADNRPDILIMSGLYGLFPAEEYLQNYDCHITDVDINSGITVKDYWGGVMTDVLLSHLAWLEVSGWTLRHVIDLLSEKSYQAAIDWSRVYPRASVLHRIFQKRAGREALHNMGAWLRKIIRDPRQLDTLRPDIFYDDPDFRDADRIAFEARLGESRLEAARD